MRRLVKGIVNLVRFPTREFPCLQKGITAEEAQKELQNDPEYLAMRAERDREFEKIEAMLTEDEESLVEELREIGCEIESVWDFVNSPNYYLDATKILKHHLVTGHHPRTVQGIARALAIPELASDEELWECLIDLYRHSKSDAEIEVPLERNMQESLAIPIEVLALPHRVPELRKLIKDMPESDGVYYFKQGIKRLAAR